MTEHRFVSVVMPTFNRLDYLRPAIQSVFSQTVQEWELLIVDDGSGPEVLDFMSAVARDERVRLTRLDHTGNPSIVRNVGVALAESPLIAFLDSDDEWLPDKLRMQLDMMEKHDECGWSYTAFVTVDALGDPLFAERERFFNPPGGPAFAAIVQTTAAIRTSGVAVRTNLLREIGGFDEAIDCSEDYDLWTRLALRSEPCVLEQPLVRYRRYSGNHERAPGYAHMMRDYSLRRLVDQVVGPQRELVRLERSRNALAKSAALSACGLHWQSLLAVFGSAGFSWRFARWWVGAAKAIFRASLRKSRHGRRPSTKSARASRGVS